MSDKDDTRKSNIGSRKKRKNKRKATSPLNDINCDQSISSGEQRKQRKAKVKKCVQENKTETVSGYPFNTNCTDLNYTNFFQTMFAQNQPAQYGMTQPSFMGSPPPAPGQFGGSAFGVQTNPPPPPWAVKLLDDMEQVKQKVQGIDKIEKTVNLISSKVSDLETQMKSLDTRLRENEKSCDFISKEHESQKNELKAATKSLGVLQKHCADLEKNTASMKQSHDTLNAKLSDLEARSMRENLLFYGIPEGGDSEDCDRLVKNLCADTLEMRGDFVRDMLFDRVHRVGQKSASKIRPIVVKFHYYTQREAVRQASFTFADRLKTEKRGIGAQIPKDIRDARKPLYPAMKQAKDSGQSVKFVGKKLFIDGVEHKQTEPGQADMEH